MLTKLGGISPSILMMQTTEYRFRKYQSSLGYGFHLAVCRRFLLNLIGNTGSQGLMRAARKRMDPGVDEPCWLRVSFANIRSARKRLTRKRHGRKEWETWQCLSCWCFDSSDCSSAAIRPWSWRTQRCRMQIAAFQRKRKRPLLSTLDRVFWITLRSLWDDWRKPLLYVQPDSVVRWQRERFRRFWARLSKPQRRGRGRPRTAAELHRLIAQMVAANPLWRAPRIHGELKMLGIAISERTVSRLLRTLRRPPNQTWRTFLHNHIGQMVSTDFFTVPTITMKVLFVFLVLEHNRRKVLHFHVTEHPTGAWTAQQIVEAFADRDTARYLLRDRDSRYSAEVRLRIQALGARRF